MPNSPSMQLEIERSVALPGNWNARCGPYEIRGARAPLGTMARKLLENGENPDVELRVSQKGLEGAFMRISIGEAAQLGRYDSALYFTKHRHPSPTE